MSTSTTVKRARVTARIAQAENTSLPTSSENTQQLLEQTENKRKQLDKKCSHYEQICRKIASLKTEKNRLEAESTQLTIQSDETDQLFTKLEKNAETSFLLQQQRSNEMNEALQQWTTLDGKEGKLNEDLKRETEVEKDLSKTHGEISSNLERLGTEADDYEKAFSLLVAAHDTDMKTEKTLEQYLARLIDDVFINQRRLENIKIGTSRDRANFRQAKKALKDQKTWNRRVNSQLAMTMKSPDSERVFDAEKNVFEQKKLEEMEKKWILLKEKIRLKETELAEESEKVQQKLDALREIQLHEYANSEKQQKYKIAKDYADLQSHTPMYAAYTAALSLNHEFVEKLEIPTTRHIVLKEPISCKSVSKSEASSHIVDLEDDMDNYSEFSKMIDNRRKVLRESENEAKQVLFRELKELEGIVSGQRQECQALNREMKWLKQNIQLRQTDIQFYNSKAEKLIQKAQREDHGKQKSFEQKSRKGDPSPLISASSKGDVLELQEKRVIMENEKQLLANQIKEKRLECDKQNDQWMILKGFAKSVNFDMIREMNEEIETWKIKVEQLEEQIDKLQKMENFASLANSQLRTNLALLKPYDEEYIEFENLVEANKQLNNQLARQEFRKSVEELQKNGDIDIIR